VVLWRIGRRSQLAGKVHVESTPLGALMGVEYDAGGVVVAARGGDPRSWRRRQRSLPEWPNARAAGPRRPAEAGPWDTAGGFVVQHRSFVSAALGDRLVPCSCWRGACMWLNSCVRSSPTQLSSYREEEVRSAVEHGPFHPIGSVGAHRYRAFGHSHGRRVRYRWRHGRPRWSSLVMTSPTQLKSCREEEGRGAVADRSSHPTT